MILRRLGNKKKIAKEIQKHFPPHKIYIEPFFGAGGMFFNKPKAKYNIVNDLDSDVFNLFQVVMNQKEELKEAFYMMPIHSDLLEYWKKNKPTNKIEMALNFIMASNMTWLGIGDKIHTAIKNHKEPIYNLLDLTFDKLEGVIFNNMDFDAFFKNISYRPNSSEIANSFYYNDPPYIETNDNYSNSFTKDDHCRLLDTNIQTGCKFAISEFDNPFVIEEAKKRNLNIIYIGERQNLKNRRTEILITNYRNERTLFDCFD